MKSLPNKPRTCSSHLAVTLAKSFAIAAVRPPQGTGDGSALQEAQNGIVLLVILSANAEQYVKAVTSVSRYEATWQVFRLQECFEAPRIPLAILEAQLVHLQKDVASDTVIAKQFSFGRLQLFQC